MSRRRRQRQIEQQQPAATSDDASRDRLRPWLLGGATALFVARPLFPSDSPAGSGDGLPVVMLWIAVAVFWMLGAIGRPTFRIRFGWTDAAVLLLVAWHTLAAVAATVRGSPRPAVNSLWEWIGLGLAFFLARQFVVGRRETRAVLAVMIGLAVGLSGYGLFQHFHSMPKTRIEYVQDPEGALRAAGLSYAEGSPERQLFEKRLETTGPIAAFALQNSLAGFLAPWLVALAGIAVGGQSRIRRDRWGGSCTATSDTPHEGAAVQLPPQRSSQLPPQRSVQLLLQRLRQPLLAAALCGVPVAACLLLTKSRSGVAAAAVGLVLVWWWCGQRRVRIGWRIPAAAGTALAVLLVAGAAAGWLNQEAFGRAKKSFGFRLHYWESTAAMIGDRPWLGCGPGNFQNEYTRYKLPEASEEVSDPHNFLMEVWATAGTPAAAALLAALGCFGWMLVRTNGEGRRVRGEGRGEKGEESAAGANPFAVRPPSDATVFVLGGAAAGVLLAWPLALLSGSLPSAAEIAIGLTLAAGAVFLLWGWIRDGRLPRLLPAAGAAALLVDLLAAGGIGFAGVAGTLWLLLAVGLNAAEDGSPGRDDRGKTLPRSAAFAGLVLAVTLAVTCYISAYDPVIRAHGFMQAARREIVERRPAEAQRHLEAAAQADPLAAEPWRHLADLALQAWDGRRNDAAFDRLQRYNEGATRRAVNSAATWAFVGESYQTIFDRPSPRWSDERRAEVIAEAVAAYQRAVGLYPNSPLYRARLALACRDAGQHARFREEAQTALELDDATPHQDKKLDRLREELTKALGQQ